MYGNLLSTKVSIHASVKDATKALDFDRIYIRVSIHASVKDATKNRLYVIKHISVSIHASVKDATYSYNGGWLFGIVSIHASVKDATKSIIFIDTHIGVSIHASVKDATLVGVKSAPLLLSFNPRICKRCDWRRRYQCRFYPCFNPRICKRCDRGAGDGDCASCVSIHASVKDATDIIDLSIHSNEFQSTHL